MTTFTATCVCKESVSASTMEKLSVAMGQHYTEKRHSGPPSFHIEMDEVSQKEQDAARERDLELAKKQPKET